MFSDRDLDEFEHTFEENTSFLGRDLLKLFIREIREQRKENRILSNDVCGLSHRLINLEALREQIGSELAETQAALKLALSLLERDADPLEVTVALPALRRAATCRLGSAFLSQIAEMRDQYGKLNKKWARNVLKLAAMRTRLYEHKRAFIKVRTFLNQLRLEEFVGAKNALTEVTITETNQKVEDEFDY